MPASVLISTFNNPEWLEKVVLGYRSQNFRDFELLIADDGSDASTGALINKMTAVGDLNIRHIRQEHDGFGKCAILNKAIAASTSDYLVFSDGDCVPRADFLQTHMRLRRPGRFISGGYCKLPMQTSKAITAGDIASQRPFDPNWLFVNGCKRIPLKISAHGVVASVLNFLTPTTPSWNGHNASGWKRDIVAVNGFDERMRYGGEDREMGERLVHSGIRPIQARHLAVCVHLDHSRGYVRQEDFERNHAIRAATHDQKRTWTAYGIVKGERTPGA
jgi:glycosyltransferase involved in cell wall biosynthesis